MKLRSGKTTGSDETKIDVEIAQAKDILIKKIKDCMDAIALISAENTPLRIEICHNVFKIVSENLDFIITPEFNPSPKFITVVYNKTYELADNIYPSLDKYIAENKPMHSKLLYNKADEAYFLLLKVREDIEKHLPGLKPKVE